MKTVNWIKEQEKLRIFRVKSLRKIERLKQMYNLPIEVRIRKIDEREGFKIFLVDGYKVRKFIDFDFTMGGHGLRYIYVPMNEIWIDKANRTEKEDIIAHEIHEFELMKKGRNYNKAHDKASLKEIEMRHKTIVLPVGHHRQITPWSCGVSALKIVLDYYERFIGIRELIKKTKCDREGTLHKNLRKVIEKLGLNYAEKENAEIGDIEEFIRRGIPVIVDYQAYHGGHFAVIIGYNKRRFVFSDPAYDNQFKWISKKEFERRWWEEDEPNVIVKRWLLAVYK